MDKPDATVITIRFLDGTEKSFTTTTWQCLADRVAFERRFEMSMAAAAEQHDGTLAQEWTAFFVWRAMNRSEHGDQGAFEPWSETLAELELEQPDTVAETPDPTEPDPTPG